MNKLSIEEVRSRFKEKGLDLISAEYIDSSNLLKYQCVCGRLRETSLGNLRRRKSGCTCGPPVRKDALTYEIVKKEFERRGCKLLSNEYVGKCGKLDYICHCGHQSKISFRHLKKQNGCKNCRADKNRLTLADIEKRCRDKGFELLETEYIGCNQKMRYKCKCGKVHSTSARAIINIKDNQCNQCRPPTNPLVSQEVIKARLEEKGFVLLSEYKGYDKDITFACKCGEISTQAAKYVIKPRRVGCVKCSKSHCNRGNTEKQKETQRQYFREYRKNNLNARIRNRMKYRIWISIRCQNGKKHYKTMEMIGCSVEFLKEYLTSRFTEGMSWDNYGKGGWSIDHILPCIAFDLTDPEQQKICFHYTNLQPLWERDNIRKSDILPDGTRARLVKIKT